jgi:hypothetical protein
MVAALVGSFLFTMAESIIAQLASREFVEAAHVLGIHNDLQHFTQTLSYIKSVLLDAEKKLSHHDHQNHELSNWLWLVRDVLFDAENVLDEVQCKNLRKKVIKGHGGGNSSSMIITKVDNFFSSYNSLAFHSRIAREIKQINIRLDKIAADRHNLVYK